MAVLTHSDADNLFRTTPDRYLDMGDGEVAYRCVGTGPDVLFVHGWPANSATFRGLLPSLVPHVTCHMIDLVGAGQSRFTRASRIDLARNIANVKRVVDVLDLKDVALVGHDSGGMIARHAMAGDPRLRSMALINTEQPQGLHWRFQQFLVMAKFPGFERVLAWAAMKPSLRKNRFLLGDCFANKALLGGTFEEFMLEPLHNNSERLWAAGQLIRNFDSRYVAQLAQVHAKISVPVQLVWGEDDPFFPVAQAREMVATFPDARLHVVPNAKLFSHEEYPDEVAEIMLPTLLHAA